MTFYQFSLIRFSCTIFRRFTHSFENLRLEQLKIKRSRNSVKLAQFENKIFKWPAKTDQSSAATPSQARGALPARAAPPARARAAPPARADIPVRFTPPVRADQVGAVPGAEALTDNVLGHPVQHDDVVREEHFQQVGPNGGMLLITLLIRYELLLKNKIAAIYLILIYLLCASDFL